MLIIFFLSSLKTIALSGNKNLINVFFLDGSDVIDGKEVGFSLIQIKKELCEFKNGHYSMKYNHSSVWFEILAIGLNSKHTSN